MYVSGAEKWVEKCLYVSILLFLISKIWLSIHNELKPYFISNFILVTLGKLGLCQNKRIKEMSSHKNLYAGPVSDKNLENLGQKNMIALKKHPVTKLRAGDSMTN